MCRSNYVGVRKKVWRNNGTSTPLFIHLSSYRSSRTSWTATTQSTLSPIIIVKKTRYNILYILLQLHYKMYNNLSLKIQHEHKYKIKIHFIGSNFKIKTNSENSKLSIINNT